MIGSHVLGRSWATTAELMGAEAVQVHLSGPRAWKAPVVRPDSDAVKAWSGSTPLYAHAPFLVNPASANPEVRAKSALCISEQLEACERLGVRGLVVHGGHPTRSGTVGDAVRNWVEVMEQVRPSTVPVLIENTAGGKAAVARKLADFAGLVRALSGVREVGICIDTCHAHAGGESLDGLVGRVLEQLGRLDLLHVNDSRDPFDSSRDRHATLGEGEIGLAAIVEVVRDAERLGVHSVVETPGIEPEHQARDIALLRAALTS